MAAESGGSGKESRADCGRSFLDTGGRGDCCTPPAAPLLPPTTLDGPTRELPPVRPRRKASPASADIFTDLVCSTGSRTGGSFPPPPTPLAVAGGCKSSCCGAWPPCPGRGATRGKWEWTSWNYKGAWTRIAWRLAAAVPRPYPVAQHSPSEIRVTYCKLILKVDRQIPNSSPFLF